MEGRAQVRRHRGVLRYDGVFGSNFLVRGMYGRHNEKNKFGGPGKTTRSSSTRP